MSFLLLNQELTLWGKVRNKVSIYEMIAWLFMRLSWLDYDGSSESKKNWCDSRCILKKEPKNFLCEIQGVR